MKQGEFIPGRKLKKEKYEITWPLLDIGVKSSQGGVYAALQLFV
jgi:hypothetical protein